MSLESGAAENVTVDEVEGGERPAAPRPDEAVDRLRSWWSRRYTFTGTAVGLVFVWLSLTPSLLPRGPLFQSLVSGGSGAIGYLIGVFAVWLVRYMRSKDEVTPAPRWAWLTLVGVGAVGTIGMVWYFHLWQSELRDIMRADQLRFVDYLQIAVMSIVVLYLLVEVGKGVRWLVQWLMRQLERICPPRVSAVIAVFVVVFLGIEIINGVLVRGTMGMLNSTFAAANDEVSADRPAPSSAVRSGGPGSLVTWESLGRQGRTFVSNAQPVARLTAFNGAPAVEPIRAYAGLGSVPSDAPHRFQAIAELAARELERTGGLRRKVVAVATTTGTGWINEAEAGGLEYMYNGDTAIVSMQYSYLPSWLSFLVDKENARQAGQYLFEAVDRRVKALPEGQRPKLVVFGESLGSFGGEAPFLSANNILARTDGALFSGPTFNNTMWEQVTKDRDPGSPQWLPVYAGGANIRFASSAEDLARPVGQWQHPRVVYLQHASDPIGRWDPDMLFSEPDWLREQRGPDVLTSTRWIPIVSFLQVSADMAVGVNVPDGHGHVYVRAVADAWAAILEPPGWTQEKTERLRPLLNAQTGNPPASAGLPDR